MDDYGFSGTHIVRPHILELFVWIGVWFAIADRQLLLYNCDILELFST